MRYWAAVLAFVVAMLVATVLTPLAARLARRVGAIAMPSERGLAERATPLLGGLAILAGVLVAGAIWLPDEITLHHTLGRGGSGGAGHAWGGVGEAWLITIAGPAGH